MTGATFLFLLMAATALGQTVNLGFSYRSAGSTQLTSLTSNGIITFPSTDVSTASIITVLAENRESATVTIDDLTVEGNGFSVDRATALVADAGQTVTLTLRFQTAKSGLASGLFSFRASTGNRQSRYSFFLSATALQAQFVVSYLFPGGNQLPVRSGATIAFPTTLVTQSATTTVIVTNNGNGKGLLNAVRATGAGFTVSGLPLMPAAILPDREIRFTVTYAPSTRGNHSGELFLDFPEQAVDVLLRGQAQGPEFSFEFQLDGVPLAPIAATLVFPETLAGLSRTMIVKITNSGDADGRVGSIAVTGASFRLPDSLRLPAAVATGQSLSFQVVFTATAPGSIRGQLQIDTTVWELAVLVRGAKLTLTASVGGVDTALADRGTLNFPNTMAGSKTTALLTVRNEGNAVGNISSLSVSGTGFTLATAVNLPATLAEGATFTFSILFAPEASGIITGTLQMDDSTYSLRGAGTPPQPLPGVTFLAVPDYVQPLSQPVIGMALAEPYPLDIIGQILMNFTPDSVGDDPAIVFSNGSRSIEFRIPIGETEAVFGSSGSRVAFQAGTVAGTIQFTASFRVAGIAMTPAPTRIVRMKPDAPQLRSLVISAKSASTVELLITGYSNQRSLNRMEITLTAAAGANLQSSLLSADVESVFRSWYQSTTSRPYGSQFTAAITLNVNGSMDAIQSIAVTASNELGASGPVSGSLR